MTVSNESENDPRSTDRGVIFAAPATIFDQIDASSKPHADFVEDLRRAFDAVIQAPGDSTYNLKDQKVLRDLANAFAFDWHELTVISPTTLAGKTDNACEQNAAVKAIIGFLIAGGYVPYHGKGGAGKSYGVSVEFKEDIAHSEPVAFLSFGSHSGSMPHITVKGADGRGHAVARLLQSTRIPFRASRIDVRLDISMETLFARLAAKMRAMADNSKKIKKPVRFIGSEGGEMARLGSTKSPVCIRVYKKDFERFEKKKIKKEDIDPNLVRIEFQFRLEGLDGVAKANMSPWQLAQSTPMTREFLHGLGAVLQLPGECEIVKGPKEVSPRTEFDAEAAGFLQYQRTFARASCATLFEAASKKLEESGQGEEQICVSEVEDLMISRFGKYVKESGVAEKVLAEFGFSDGVSYDPEDRAERIIKLAHKQRLQRYNNRLESLAQTLDLYADLEFPDEFLRSVSRKIETMEEAIFAAQDEEPFETLETLKTVWGHIRPPEIYLYGLDHYLASRGFRQAPALTEIEFEFAHALEGGEECADQ